MKLPITSLRAVAIIAILVSVIALIVSPVSASAVSPSGDVAGVPAGTSAHHHAFNSTRQAARLQTTLATLGQQGVDVSQAQADLASGNVTAAAQWLMAYHKDHPGPEMNGSRQHAVNATTQAERLQAFVTKLGQNGVDVSQAQTDLASGNTNGAMQWLMAYHKDHPGMMANSTQQATRLQSGVTKLAQQGVDVSEVQADLASGNVSAAMQWMAAYHKAHPVQNTHPTAWQSGNSTPWQRGGSFRPHHAGSGNQTATHPSGSPVPVQGT